LNARPIVTCTRLLDARAPSISWASLLRPYGLDGTSGCSSVSGSLPGRYTIAIYRGQTTPAQTDNQSAAAQKSFVVEFVP